MSQPASPPTGPVRLTGPLEQVVDVVRPDAASYLVEVGVLVVGTLLLLTPVPRFGKVLLAIGLVVALVWLVASVVDRVRLLHGPATTRLDWLDQLLPAGEPAAWLLLHTGPGRGVEGLRRRWPGAEGVVVVVAASFPDPLRRSPDGLTRGEALVGRVPLPPGSLDVAVVLSDAHDLGDELDRSRAVADLARLLRQGGRLVIADREPTRGARALLGPFMGGLAPAAEWERAATGAGLVAAGRTEVAAGLAPALTGPVVATAWARP